MPVVEYLVPAGLALVPHYENGLYAGLVSGNGPGVDTLDDHSLGEQVELIHGCFNKGGGRSPTR